MDEWERNADAVAKKIAAPEEYDVEITRERTETYANIAESAHRNALQITLDAAKNVDVAPSGTWMWMFQWSKMR